MRPFALACTILCLVVAVPAARAQGTRFPAPRVNLGGDVYDSTVVDIDADGWPDLVAGANGLCVRRGLGDGSFGALESYFPGTPPHGLTIIDVDLDGDLDVVACRSATGTGPNDLIVIKQKPDHTFGPLTTYSAITWPWDTAGGDLNGDGWPDLVVTSTNTSLTASQVQVRLATAPGVFGAAVTVPLALGADDVVLADFNGDGQLDLASDCGSAGVVSVRIGDGAGGFGPLVTYPMQPNSRSLQAADLDADEFLDLVVGQDDLGGSFEILYGVGDGTFEPSVSIDSGFIYPRETAIADIDRDGILDLAVDTGYRLTLLYGLGGRDYADPLHMTIGSTMHSAVSLADLELDGWLDVVVDNLWARDATVLLAEGDSEFVTADLYDGPSTFSPGVSVADFDGDGVLDVFATNMWTDSATTWMGNGDGTFTVGPSMSVPDVSWSAEAGLLDDDDVLDLLILDRTTNTANVFLGQGDGSFTAGQVLGTGGAMPRESALADLDHDGLFDAVVVNETPRTARVLIGNGDGTFTSGALLGPFEGQDLRNLALGDVTGDGDVDLVLGAFAGGVWRLVPGDGAGGFPATGSLYQYAAPDLAKAGDSVRDIKLVDVNHDGRLDALHSDYNGESVRLYLNNGSQALEYFDQVSVIALPAAEQGPAELTLADFDVDGELDLGVGMGGSERIDLLFGDGAGGFTAAESYSVDETAEFVRAGDWDQDGAADLLAVAQSISVLVNNTLARWQSLGQGSNGFDGIPWLHGDGSPSAGQPVTLQIEHGRPSSAVVFVVGLTTLNAPFKGGTMVPHPDLLLYGLSTNGAGELSVSSTWPAIPGTPKIYLQAWLLDASSPTGLAGSGGLRILDQ